jgi:hypothetical protein
MRRPLVLAYSRAALVRGCFLVPGGIVVGLLIIKPLRNFSLGVIDAHSGHSPLVVIGIG